MPLTLAYDQRKDAIGEVRPTNVLLAHKNTFVLHAVSLDITIFSDILYLLIFMSGVVAAALWAL